MRSTIRQLSIVDTAALSVRFGADNGPSVATVLALFGVGGWDRENGRCEGKKDGSGELHFGVGK